MGWRNKYLDIDIQKRNFLNIEVNQADDVFLHINLYDNGQPLNLANGEDTVVISFVNANNTITADSDIGKNFDKNLLEIYLNKNCTNSCGIAKMQVTINTTKKDVTNRQVTTFPIEIKVNKSIMDGQEVSKNVNSMLSSLNNATIQGQQVIKNITETATKYPTSSQLYSDVEDLKGREYGAENLLLDSGFLSGNIGTGFPWYAANTNSTVKVVESDSSTSGKSVKITSSTGQAGIAQYVTVINSPKAYTVSFKVYGNAGTQINASLSNAETKSYVISKSNTWEYVTLTFTKNLNSWSKSLVIFSQTVATFYLQDIALWEGKKAFTYKYNSKDLIYDRLRISGQDLRLISKSGKYCGVGCLNSPFNDSGWGFYDIEVHSSAYKKIIAHNYSANDIFVCSCINGTWTGWEQIANQSFCKNPANITQDSTHRFVTDAEKSLWNKYTRVFKQSFNNVTNVTVSCSSNVTSDHVVADFFIGNKENVTDFSWKVNNTVIRTETGGGVVILHIDFGRTSTNTWIYRITGKIEITSAGEYTIDHIGTITGTTEITSLGLATNGTDNFNCCSAIIKKY